MLKRFSRGLVGASGGAETLAALHRPALIDGQRASTSGPRVQALLAALLRFDLLWTGFRNRQLREAALIAARCGGCLDPARRT